MLKLLIALLFPGFIASKFLFRPVGFEFRSSASRSDGCIFGKRHYQIGKSWHPNVSPFGVLRCVLCSCIKHPKKPGNFGKAYCRSTRHRCPRTSCTNPELKPNQCCPTCPPEFVALLTPPHAQPLKQFSHQNVLARLHVIAIKHSLHISVRYDGIQRPKTLLLFDAGDIKLGELNIHKKFINGTKVCLTLENLDKDSMNKILNTANKGIKVVLKFKRKAGTSLSGLLTLHNGYSEDAFEAMLQSKLDSNVHMAAIATISLTRNGKNLNVNLQHTKLTHAVGKTIVANLQFVKAPLTGKIQILKTIAMTSLNAIGGQKKVTWSSPSEQQLKWMARGIINITLTVTAAGKTVEMTGKIGIKKTCNTVYALLAGREASRPTVTGASGYVSFHFQDNGRLKYEIALSGLMKPVIEIILEMGRKRLVKKLSRSLSGNELAHAQVEDVWERPSVAEICSLISGGFSVNVRTVLYRRGELRGYVKQLPYGGYHASYEDSPFLLSGNDVVPSTRTGASGLTWLSLDRHCSLHYHVLLKGLDRGKKNTITADLLGFAFYGEQPLSFDKKKNKLRSFYGNMISGVERNLDTEFLTNLIRGRVYLQISSNDSPRGELRGQIKLQSGQCNVPTTEHFTIEGSCVSEGRTYFNGEAWVPDYDQKCTTCSCKDTTVSCFPVICSPQNCTESPVILPDKCCPVCPVMEEEAIVSYKGHTPPNIKGCFVDQGRKFYPSGSVWHPYVEPFGYMKCVVCTCLVSSNEITCSKVQCPKPACPLPVKKVKSDCCLRCPAPVKVSKAAAQPKVCQFGQNTYPNGARWSPFIPPFGLLKCVTCDCKNSKTNCITVKCPKNHCKRTFGGPSKSCCTPCTDKLK